MNQPAFPVIPELCQDLTVEEQRGMTLRDYFAAKAMQAALTGCATRSETVLWTDMAAIAYEMADAMMEARDGE
jgi:hypothetical protein